MDETNKLKFYFIDIIEAGKRMIEDISLKDKLYHRFEKIEDAEGNRVFQKGNSGMVFESFQLMDHESSPVLFIVASDSSHQGNVKMHPLYCK